MRLFFVAIHSNAAGSVSGVVGHARLTISIFILFFLRGKALGLRQRQDWHHWFGSLLREVRQLSEDLWQPRHQAG